MKPGSFAALLAALLLRMSPLAFGRLLLSVCRQLFLPTVTVTAVLAMAFVMNYCGATATLGLAFAASGMLFPFFSPLLGWLGVFLTGSDTSSNVLFGDLQRITAIKLKLNPILMASANTTGGVMGKMISPQNIATGVSVTHLKGQEGVVFARTFVHSIVLTIVLGLLVALQQYVIPGIIPG